MSDINDVDDKGLTIQMLRDRLEDMEKRLRDRRKELDSQDN